MILLMRSLFTIIISSCLFSSVFAQSFTTHYYSIEEINNYLSDVAEQDQDIESHSLGDSKGNVPINYLVFGNSAKTVFINGTHHGDEYASTNAVLSLIQYIAENKDKAPVLQEFLNEYSIVVQPVVNPDGYKRAQRANLDGFDVNRDYIVSGDSITPESQLVMNLLAKYEPLIAMAFHSGMRGILWPYGYTGKAPEDYDVLEEIGNAIANAINYEISSQSFYDYKTVGEFIDYAYTVHGTLAFTVEVSNEKIPQSVRELVKVQQETIAGFRVLMSKLLD